METQGTHAFGSGMEGDCIGPIIRTNEADFTGPDDPRRLTGTPGDAAAKFRYLAPILRDMRRFIFRDRIVAVTDVLDLRVNEAGIRVRGRIDRVLYTCSTLVRLGLPPPEEICLAASWCFVSISIERVPLVFGAAQIGWSMFPEPATVAEVDRLTEGGDLDAGYVFLYPYVAEWRRQNQATGQESAK